jgi:hypothetical protein
MPRRGKKKEKKKSEIQGASNCVRRTTYALEITDYVTLRVSVRVCVLSYMCGRILIHIEIPFLTSSIYAHARAHRHTHTL